MKIIFINSLKQENLFFERLKKMTDYRKLGIIYDKIPLLSNLSVLENIALPVSYHHSVGFSDIKMRILKELNKNFISENILYYRKSEMDLFQIFFVKFLQVYFYNPDFYVFVIPLKILRGENEDKFFDLLIKYKTEKFVIIDYNNYEEIYASKLKYSRIGFDEWVTRDLRV